MMSSEDGKVEEPRGSRTNFMVAWIAIGVGVTMVIVGGILLLWGLSYQASVGEPVDLQSDPLTGGPLLIPIGVMSLAFGTLWVHYGLKGFRKEEEKIGMKKCPNCKKLIEEDLNFCYHCTVTFSDSGIIGEEDDEEEDEEDTSKEDDNADRERDMEPTSAQLARARRQEERRRKREEMKGERRAKSLELDQLN
jgi:hypothetical protein